MAPAPRPRPSRAICTQARADMRGDLNAAPPAPTTTPQQLVSTHTLPLADYFRLQKGPPRSNMASAGNSPFLEPGASEFALRPLRIQKRAGTTGQDKQDKAPKTGKAARAEGATKADGAADQAGFVCRPMRLGLASTPQRKPSMESTGSRAPQEPAAGAKTPVPATNTPVRAARALGEPPAPPAAGHGKHPSVEIRNLPIEPAPRRAALAETAAPQSDRVFAVCLVDFHHARGPEVLWWRSNYLARPGPELFRNLPFQALPDGLHLFEETFSNFNLVYDFATQQSLDDLRDIECFRGNPNHLETLFGCACVRQVKTAELSETERSRTGDITRSIVQKAVVVLSRHLPVFTKIKEKLSIITHSFFQQESFGNFELLESLFDNLNEQFRGQQSAPGALPVPDPASGPHDPLEPVRYEDQEEYFVNLDLRALLARFQHELLVVFKALLMEKRVLVYSNNNLELLTQFQNNMIALVPNLIHHLELSGCPLCDYTEKHSPLEKPATLKTNDRVSMLRFFGLPLQVFNTKGCFWNPYLPLPQMDELKAPSFMVGCSNLLIVNQLARFKVDVLVDLDAGAVSYPCGRPEELRLLPLDKKFVSVLLAAHTTDESYEGSDDYIRYQFEDYVRSLLATVRFQQYVDRFKLPPPGFDPQADKRLGSLKAFNSEFVKKWQHTKNYQIWNATCDEFIFNFQLPTHFATEMDEAGAAYRLGGFLSSLIKAPQPQNPNVAERSSQSFSHTQQPRKYIASDGTAPDLVPEPAAAKSTWWGFKKA